MRAWAQVNLDNIAHNIRQIRRITRPHTKIMAVVKADAYGHGAVSVSRTLLANGADTLGVATFDEAIQLRNAGIDAPILMLSPIPQEDVTQAVAHDVTVTVFDLATAQCVSRAAQAQGRSAKVHIKLDTGMSRVGYRVTGNAVQDAAVAQEIALIAALPCVTVEGIFTHFSKSDEADRSFTDLQYERFSAMCTLLEQQGVHIPVRHVCNSAATVKFPEYHLDMVRCGIILYGHMPSDEMAGMANVTPAMELKTTVTNLSLLPQGTPVSYGGNYVTDCPKKIATLGIGYADGFSRVLSDRAQVLIGGQTADIVGNICMDQCMADVSHMDEIKIGDEVILFGKSGNTTITVESVAFLRGTISYEVLCVIGKRVPRVYIQNGEIVSMQDVLV